MRWGFCNFFFALLTLISMKFTTAHATDQKELMDLLNVMTTDLEDLHDFGVHENDRGRIKILLDAASMTRENLSKFGPIHSKTSFSFYNLSVMFRYSEGFFEFIRTAGNQESIVELFEDISKIRTALGLDETPYLSILEVNLKNIERLILALVKMDRLSNSLRGVLRGLLAPLGDAISKAQSNGDRPVAFKAAEELFYAIRAAYPDMDKELLASSDTLYMYQELQGLNEFIGEYAQAAP